MQILVCGMARSGNSLVAHIAAQDFNGQYPLLDDPIWAIERENGFLHCLFNEVAMKEVNEHSVVKCPRALQSVEIVNREFPSVEIFVVFRDPRDVYCSIVEAVLTGNKMPRSMLDYYFDGASFFKGFVEKYNSQYTDAIRCFRSGGLIRFVNYEKVCDSIDTSAKATFGVNFSPEENNISGRIWGPGRYKEHLPKPICNDIWSACRETYNTLLDLLVR